MFQCKMSPGSVRTYLVKMPHVLTGHPVVVAVNQELGFSLGHRKRLLALLDCLREGSQGRAGKEGGRSEAGDGGSRATHGWLSTSAV